MANGMQLLTGHQAVNHISAADEAGLNTALITGENVVIANEREITCEADLTGTLTVGAFVALFSGRKVACAGATGTYTQPSAGMYRRVSVGVLYTKNTQDDDVEDCDLAVYTSAAESASQSTAAGYDTGKPSATAIESETTEAYFELFDLVVSTTEIVTKTPVYSVFAGEKNEHARVDDLVERMETAEDDIDTLQGQTTNLMPRMTLAEDNIDSLDTKIEQMKSSISIIDKLQLTSKTSSSLVFLCNRNYDFYLVAGAIIYHSSFSFIGLDSTLYYVKSFESGFPDYIPIQAYRTGSYYRVTCSTEPPAGSTFPDASGVVFGVKLPS